MAFKEIKVLPKDIKNGQPESHNNCPIAKAVKRTFDATMVSVTDQDVIVYTPEGNLHFDLPYFATAFVLSFDNKQEVRPFRFTVDPQPI